jgi:hypothetical protein
MAEVNKSASASVGNKVASGRFYFIVKEYSFLKDFDVLTSIEKGK